MSMTPEGQVFFMRETVQLARERVEHMEYAASYAFDREMLLQYLRSLDANLVVLAEHEGIEVWEGS